MPWCPKCKNEYVEGVTVCADCGTPLVESLTGKKKDIKEKTNGELIPILFGPKENVTGILEALHNAGISSAVLKEKEGEEDGSMELYVDENDKDRTVATVQEIIKAKEDLERMQAARQARMEEAKKEKYEAYVSSKDKAKEMKNSAIMLLIIAAIGFLFIALMAAHVLPFGFGTGGRAIFCYGVLGGFFGLLLVSGILSLRSSSRMSVKSGDEEDLKKKVKDWMNQTFTHELMDGIAKNAEDENQMYFARSEYMKRKLMTEFPDLKENLADELVEEKYGELYD